ncbi:MAG: hypothetical protein KF803_11460 [Cyclobacteriaceae bacterium]|nr:hypothetical protein [Cyclobacteriaceae bacterium]
MKRLTDKVLRVVGLLVGLMILQIAITFAIPYVTPTDNPDLFIALTIHGHWIGNIIYGLIIYALLRQGKTVAIPIGLLSIMTPVYGGVFYLLTTFNERTPND